LRGHDRCFDDRFMKRLGWLTLTLVLTACSADTTALDPTGTGGTGTAGGGGSSGSGGAGRGRPDGSIEATGGTGGSGGSTGGAGGSMGGTGGSVKPDAGPPDMGRSDGPPADAGDICQACTGFVTEYANAIRKEQACNPTAPNQCLKQTPGQLTCGCPVWVTTTVLSDDVRARFQAAGCLKCFRFTACPAIACVNPGTGVCVPVMAAGDPPGGGVPIVAPPMGQCMTKF
jgi:hypothetical protein